MHKKPFLKWVGSKFNLVPEIIAILPQGKRLIEPFAGSAALFLNTNFNNYLLAEINSDLIDLYQQLQTNSEQFIAGCKVLFQPAFNTEDKFYMLREEFNQTQDPLRRAQLFVYLNRHGFRGLCRYNSKGQYNVPFGWYSNRIIKLPILDMQYFSRHVVKAELLHEDFSVAMDRAEIGDVVYCDPPYAPLSKSANFTKYSQNGFTFLQQQQLVQQAEQLATRGVPVIISNHDTPETRALYKNANIKPILAPRRISRHQQAQRHVNEVLAIYQPV